MTTLTKAEVTETMARYSQYVSDKRYTEWAALFTENGQLWDTNRLLATGPSELEKYLRRVHKNIRVKQITTNYVIELGDEGATAVSDYIIFSPTPFRGFDVAAMGRYVDEFDSSSGCCLFAKRTFIPLGEGLDSTTLANFRFAQLIDRPPRRKKPHVLARAMHAVVESRRRQSS